MGGLLGYAPHSDLLRRDGAGGRQKCDNKERPPISLLGTRKAGPSLYDAAFTIEQDGEGKPRRMVRGRCVRIAQRVVERQAKVAEEAIGAGA